MSAIKYDPFETVTWVGVNGHKYENEADEHGNLWTWNADHIMDGCPACEEGLPEEDW
jgi:hypothetical protein